MNYYDEATEAMALTTTLAAQIGAFGEVFARNVAENRRHDVVTDESELLRLLATDLDGGLRRMSTFLAPYVVQAKERGELAPDVEEDEASELLARHAHDTDRDAVVDCLRHATTAHRRPVPGALCSRRFGCRTHTTLIGRSSTQPLRCGTASVEVLATVRVEDVSGDRTRDRSDNRNTAASAYSSGAGSRRTRDVRGVAVTQLVDRDPEDRSALPKKSSSRSPAIFPGASVLTRIPAGPSSRASERAMPTMACLPTLYAPNPTLGWRTTAELTMTIEPRPAAPWRGPRRGSDGRRTGGFRRGSAPTRPWRPRRSERVVG